MRFAAPVADRRDPEIGDAGHLHRSVQRIDQLVGGHAFSPLIAWFEVNHAFEHRQRCRVGRGIGAPRLAEHALDLGNGLDHPVGLLEQLGRLGGRNPRQRRRHVEQIALVHLRQEFAAELTDGPQARGEDETRDQDRRLRADHDPVDRGTVNPRQPAIDRIGLPNFLEGVGVEIDPNMVNHPRTNSIVPPKVTRPATTANGQLPTQIKRSRMGIPIAAVSNRSCKLRDTLFIRW